MDPNQKNQTEQATSHVVIPAPTNTQSEPQSATTVSSPEPIQPTQNPFQNPQPGPVQNPIQESASPIPNQDTPQPDPQALVNEALRDQAPNMYANWTPPQHQSAFQEMNSPQIHHPQNQDPSFPHQVPPKREPGRYSKRIAIGMLAILAIVGLPATIYLTQQQQNTKQEATTGFTDDTVVAIYDGQIKIKDLRAVAEEQYAPTAVNNTVLKIALNILLERKILDKEKINQKISISQQEVDDLVLSTGLPEKEAYYKILRTKVGLTNARNWQVYTIGFWAAPSSDLANLTDEEKASRSAILAQGLPALKEAEQRLRNGETASIIAENLLAKYPALNGVLAVNGTIITRDIESPPELDEAEIFYYEPSGEGQPFYDTLYSMSNDGSVKSIVFSDNSGGSVIKLVKYHPETTFNSYKDWLDNKKSLVKIVYSL